MLNLMQDRETKAVFDLETLRACVAEGIADADAGRLSDAEDVYARLRAHIEAIATSKTR